MALVINNLHVNASVPQEVGVWMPLGWSSCMDIYFVAPSGNLNNPQLGFQLDYTSGAARSSRSVTVSIERVRILSHALLLCAEVVPSPDGDASTARSTPVWRVV